MPPSVAATEIVDPDGRHGYWTRFRRRWRCGLRRPRGRRPSCCSGQARRVLPARGLGSLNSIDRRRLRSPDQNSERLRKLLPVAISM